MSDAPQQLVFAQQTLAGVGGAQASRNDLYVMNSSDTYTNSGLTIGSGGNFNNLRLSYSLTDSAASIVTDALNINVEQMYFKNLSSAVALQKPMNQLVIDPMSGAVREGYPAFALGNLNDIVPSIQADINTLKASLGLEVQQTASLQSVLGYVAIALVILLLILVVVLFVRFAKLREATLKKVVAPLAQGSFAPSFTPQTFTPQTFTPQTFTPSFTPQTFTPSFTPQTFAPQAFPSFTGTYMMPSLRR